MRMKKTTKFSPVGLFSSFLASCEEKEALMKQRAAAETNKAGTSQSTPASLAANKPGRIQLSFVLRLPSS